MCCVIAPAVSPGRPLDHQGPRRSGTLVFPAEDGATRKNNPVRPGRPPQPGVGALDKQRGGFCCHCIRINLFISLAHALQQRISEPHIYVPVTACVSAPARHTPPWKGRCRSTTHCQAVCKTEILGKSTSTIQLSSGAGVRLVAA